MSIWSKDFWKAVTERAVKSAAQGAVAVWGIATIADGDAAINTAQAAGWGALSMGVLSVLTSLASGLVGNNGPSLANETIIEPPGNHEVAP